MKLVTWNCQGAFRKKLEFVLKQCPDILIVQECEHPDKLIYDSAIPKPNDVLWFGDNKNKGLGVFSYSDYKFELVEQYNENIKTILPILVTGGAYDFMLFAIWANNRLDPDGQYIEQVWKAVNHYTELLKGENIILIGDFNSNKIWDKKHRAGNHSAVVQKLLENNIHSAYHLKHGQEQGVEDKPTFFLQRNVNKPYHIDYCFLSNSLYEKVTDLEIGKYDDWITYSDHMPLTINFK